MSNGQKTKIGIDRLRPGHYVELDVAWMDHPFLFSRFTIESQKDIAVIRALGLKEITIDPDRSRGSAAMKSLEESDASATEPTPTGESAATVVNPTPTEESAATVARPKPVKETSAAAANPTSTEEETATREAGAAKDALWNNKQSLIDRDAEFRKERMQIAVRYQDTVKKVSSFARDLRSGPANTIQVAEEIVGDMVNAFDTASEVLVNLVNLTDANFTMHTHSLNVTVLSLLLARHLGLESEEIRSIGMGALIHDIGKTEIPAQILNKVGKLTPSEEALLRTHPLKGVRLAQKVQNLSPEVAAIIEQHHQYLDGSGYPRGLKGGQIWLSVRIVAITNVYDNLCNPPNPQNAISPRDAMAVLYKGYQGKLDADLVSTFIKAMGVYPPGTIVRLSDDNIGMVVSVDPDELLRPRVIIYNPDIPRWNAMMIDLRERADLDVKEVMKPTECPPQLYEYLGISDRLGYFYESH